MHIMTNPTTPVQSFSEFVASEATRLGVSVATATYHSLMTQACAAASAHGRISLSPADRAELDAAWASMSPAEHEAYRLAP